MNDENKFIYLHRYLKYFGFQNNNLNNKCHDDKLESYSYTPLTYIINHIITRVSTNNYTVEGYAILQQLLASKSVFINVADGYDNVPFKLLIEKFPYTNEANKSLCKDLCKFIINNLLERDVNPFSPENCINAHPLLLALESNKQELLTDLFNEYKSHIKLDERYIINNQETILYNYVYPAYKNNAEVLKCFYNNSDKNDVDNTRLYLTM